jgi:DNA (cytosine-5)-methyltransferase 1
MKKQRTIDLFAGIGGIRLAFEKAGFETVYANDFDQKCELTYNLNFNKTKLTISDIKKINIDDLPKFDILLGGFPCQPFSIAGKRLGFKDERGTLFEDIVKILIAKKPIGFLLENVKNLSGVKFEETFTHMLKMLNDIGYSVKHSVLNTLDYGNIPQNRERVYIVGFLKNTNFIDSFEFPKKIELNKKIVDLLETEVDSKYYYNDKPLFEKLKDYPFRKNVVYQWRRKYIRENKRGVSPTLTANMGTGGHNVPIVLDSRGVRKLTPRECARLQGFPESYKFPNIADSYIYKQIGNSVSVTVVARIAKKIMKAMNK